MLSWKDKVTEKLSQLFSDSSTSHSPPLHQSEARPYPNEDKSLSSVFSFNLPSLSFDGFAYNKDRHVNKPIAASLQDKPLDSCEECSRARQVYSCHISGTLPSLSKRTSSSQAEDQEYGSGRSNEHVNRGVLSNHNDLDAGSGRSTRSSDVFEDATNLCNADKSMACLTVDSCFISSDLYIFLMSSLPNMVKGCQWILLYSTAKHGISLRTLIRRSADHSGPCLLIVGDKQGAVFGGLLDCPLKPTPKRKYQGTIQTFVFTTIYGEPRIFRPTGANRYFYMCLSDLLALGGGGNFALCLNEDLLTGTSGPCETFGNLCLAHSPEFELKNVELWGFAHSSRYLT